MYFYDFCILQRFLHKLVNFFFKLSFGFADHIQVRLGNRMLRHKNSAAILKWLNRSLKGINFSGYFHDLLFVKANHRTVNRQSADLVCGRKALQCLACDLADALACDQAKAAALFAKCSAMRIM